MVFPYQGIFQALTKIGQKHGLVGLWRGAMGGLPRVIIGSSTQLCTFSSTKDLMTQWEVLPGKGVGPSWECGQREGKLKGALEGTAPTFNVTEWQEGLESLTLYTLPTVLLSFPPRRCT